MKISAFLFIPIISLLFVQPSNAQQRVRKELIDTPWRHGKITLTDGETLQGFVRYNEDTGLLSFSQKTDTITFTSKTIQAFSISDTTSIREFVSIEYNTDAYNGLKTSFFERIREYPSFAILSRIEPLVLYVPKGLEVTGHDTRVDQIFTFYFASEDGKIIPFMRHMFSKASPLPYLEPPHNTTRFVNDRKNLFFDKILFEKYIGKEQHKALKTFAKERKLKFTERPDFLTILKHYDEIRTE